MFDLAAFVYDRLPHGNEPDFKGRPRTPHEKVIWAMGEQALVQTVPAELEWNAIEDKFFEEAGAEIVARYQTLRDSFIAAHPSSRAAYEKASEEGLGGSWVDQHGSGWAAMCDNSYSFRQHSRSRLR